MAHLSSEVIEAAVLGRLDPAAAPSVERHIQRCVLCNERLNEAREYVSAMREALRILNQTDSTHLIE